MGKEQMPPTELCSTEETKGLFRKGHVPSPTCLPSPPSKTRIWSPFGRHLSHFRRGYFWILSQLAGFPRSRLAVSPSGQGWVSVSLAATSWALPTHNNQWHSWNSWHSREARLGPANALELQFWPQWGILSFIHSQRLGPIYVNPLPRVDSSWPPGFHFSNCPRYFLDPLETLHSVKNCGVSKNSVTKERGWGPGRVEEPSFEVF